MSERVFKIFWKDQVRRFSAPVVSWNLFQEKLRLILGGDYHPELQVQYIDDEGDRVELATQYEWEACLAQVPAGGMVKLYIKPHDHGIYFKDSPPPKIVGVHFSDPSGNQTAVERNSPLASAISGTVPAILASFFPDGKILPRNIPDWLSECLLAKNQDPFSADVDIDVVALIDAIFARALKTMDSNLELADDLWGKALVIAQSITPSHSKLSYIYYNIACSKSLLGHKAEAITNLRAAIESGYTNFEHASKDTDLANIREEPEFEILITEKIRKTFAAGEIIGIKVEPMEVEKEEEELEEAKEEPKEELKEESKEEPKEEEPEAPFATELATLKSMGFTQPDNTLIVLLAAYNGDVNGVVGHLFSQ